MIVVIGKSGQLAKELADISNEEQLVCLGRNDIDITSMSSIEEQLGKHKPTAVINASAYTAVDKAETEKEQAFLINHKAVENLANYCKTNNVHFVHVSTDYVFKGDKGSPYLPNDTIEPQGVYGASKAAGERAIADICPNISCIIRTSWVYSQYGNNFVKTMLKLMQEKDELGIICDQIGSPTWAKGLAHACVNAAENKVVGIHHWTDSGVASWYDFAVAIQEIGIEQGLVKKITYIKPIMSEEYITAAKRPSYSVLNKLSSYKYFQSDVFHWKSELTKMMNNLAELKYE
ncbi:dTDP-4-dehydrorhamnose reductase [Colwellia sp. RSH04]|nr:dTDP-4-dehydrorhamnose reductase [Colwellia sp. RSH04]